MYSDNLTDQAIRDQLERVVRSSSLKRARRLQQFLRYITELTLAGEESKINEYLLGIDVFERGSDYNAAEDSIVRRQAHALRHKLGEYYRAEGKLDPIFIEIPLGHYVPIFKPNDQAASVTVPASPPNKVPSGVLRMPATRYMVVIAMLAATGLASAYWLGRATAQQGSTASGGSAPYSSQAVQELWSAWLSAEEGPLLCFSSPLMAILKDYATPLPANANPPRWTLPEVLEKPFRETLGLTNNGYFYISPTISETKSGESLGAVQLTNLFASQGLPVRATRSVLLTWEDFRQENIILFGHTEQNSWLAPLLANYPLQLQDTSGERQRRIVNTDPRPDDPEYYEINYPSQKGELTVEYALVSMLPGTDGLHELLIVSGLNTQATLMAVEFLTHEERVAQLLDSLRREAPESAGSWRFQLVLRAEVREQVPTGGAIELVRVITPETRGPAAVYAAAGQ
jgi:hypothetical protein